MTARRRLGSVAVSLAAVVWLTAATGSRGVGNPSPTTRHDDGHGADRLNVGMCTTSSITP
jgi:hypothetical protein